MDTTADALFGSLQDKQKNHLAEARRLIMEWVMNKPSIDKLLQDKVDDFIIVRELPLPIKIGERTIYIGTFTLETQDIFFREYAILMAAITARHAGLEYGVQFLKDGVTLYKLLSSDAFIRKWIYRLIKKTILARQDYIDPVSGKKYKLEKVSLRYFKKRVTIDTLMQILLLIYIYNFDATKKSMNLLMGEMGAKATSETLMWSWLRNLDGASGKFLLSPLASFISPVSELQNPTSPGPTEKD